MLLIRVLSSMRMMRGTIFLSAKVRQKKAFCKGWHPKCNFICIIRAVFNLSLMLMLLCKMIIRKSTPCSPLWEVVR